MGITPIEYGEYVNIISDGCEQEKCIAIGKLCAEDESTKKLVAGVILYNYIFAVQGKSNEFIKGIIELKEKLTGELR